MADKHKYFDDQLDDEDVLFVFKKHPVVMRKGLVIGMLGPLLGIAPAAIPTVNPTKNAYVAEVTLNSGSNLNLRREPDARHQTSTQRDEDRGRGEHT